MAGRRDIEAGAAFVRLFLKDHLTRALVRTLRSAGQSLQSFGRKTMAAGRTLAVAGIAMLAPLAFATQTFADFDDEMRFVAAVAPKAATSLAGLTKTAKELGRTTSFMATEVASGMSELGRAGFDTTAIDQSIDSVLNLSRATRTELPRAAEIAANTLRSFALPVSDFGRVVDVMTATANTSSQTLEELGETMGYAAPIAEEFGLTLEQTAKRIGAMANFGIKGSKAGTAFRMMMLQLADPKIRKEHKIQGETFAEMIDSIAKQMQTMSNLERLSFAKDIFGQRAIGAGIKLTKASFKDLSDAVDDAGGTAERTAKKMDAGLGGSLRMLWSAVEGTKLAIGEALSPVIKDLSADLIEINGIITKTIEKNPGLVTGFATFAATVAAAGVALIATGMTITGIGFTLSALATIISAVMSPITLISAALIYGVVQWARWTDKGRSAVGVVYSLLGELGDIAKDTFGGIADAISSGDIQLAAKIAFAGVKLAAVQSLDAIKDIVGEDVTAIGGLLMNGEIPKSWARTAADMKIVWDSFVGDMKKEWESAIAYLMEKMKPLHKALAKHIGESLEQGGSGGIPGLVVKLDVDPQETKRQASKQAKAYIEALKRGIAYQQERVDLFERTGESDKAKNARRVLEDFQKQLHERAPRAIWTKTEENPTAGLQKEISETKAKIAQLESKIGDKEQTGFGRRRGTGALEANRKKLVDLEKQLQKAEKDFKGAESRVVGRHGYLGYEAGSSIGSTAAGLVGTPDVTGAAGGADTFYQNLLSKISLTDSEKKRGLGAVTEAAKAAAGELVALKKEAADLKLKPVIEQGILAAMAIGGMLPVGSFPGAGGAVGGGGGGGGGGGEGDKEKIVKALGGGDRGITTFSAAGAMAAGFGGKGGPQERMAEGIKVIAEEAKVARKDRMEMIRKDAEMIASMEELVHGTKRPA